MHVRAAAIICSIRVHGEHGAIVRALTPEDGLLPGYVRGGRSRRLRPVLIPGNLVEAEFRARSEEQLAGLTVELLHSRAPLLAEPLAAAAIDWVTALTAATLPEGMPVPALHDALDGVLAAIEAAPAARGWAASLARYEQLVLRELGYGAEAGAELLVQADWPGILAALERTGMRLGDELLTGRRGEVLAARERLVMRLKRAAG
ncbi:DNA repair protein RecO [Sphingomonas sanxanigenens]|uniref:DNA replication/recombination mediator RecO N-terminal domain-containing protein n=1 Tax=Sphingomonas sanxanigenens DSM 19645 = NX02 TaxID=1123269 RepID=W0A6E3_9SPHN|nr:recombination protein O N-terminal domain-containing protein [Sphingomonas sanxanigenens]AHE53499.1 hypothetical protein NX02_08880 [Sphingomonas sanxanigenens DSM 19645 = NX02]